jgi:hypothetical protein
MSKSQLSALDNRDDRTALWGLLSRLPPEKRLSFLAWACAQAPPGKGRLPTPVPGTMRVSVDGARRCDKADMKHVNECFMDVLSLLNDFGVDALKLAAELEKRVRALR